jgi:HK97 family phage major capsid protein
MFKTIQEAFNHYRTHSVEQIETRAAEIKRTIETDAGADVAALNIELEGMKQAKENAREKLEQREQFNPITGTSFERRAEPVTGDVLDSAEYRSAFFKTMLGQELTAVEKAAYRRAALERRAEAFNTVDNSAAVVPTQTLNEVVRRARTQGGLISVCRAFALPANVNVPIGTPSGAAQWHTEGANVEREKLGTVNVSFSAWEILKVFSVSAKARRMTISAFENYLTEELHANIVETIARSLISGTGVNQGTGILTGITWNADNTREYTGAIAYNDIVEVIAMLKRGYANNAKFAMNNATLYRQIYGLVDANKRPLFIQDPRTESIGRLLGFPIVIDDFLPDGVILFGDFRYMSYNMAEGIAIESSTQSGFTRGLIDYRAMAICDTKPILSEAFIKLTVGA